MTFAITFSPSRRIQLAEEAAIRHRERRSLDSGICIAPTLLQLAPPRGCCAIRDGARESSPPPLRAVAALIVSNLYNQRALHRIRDGRDKSSD